MKFDSVINDGHPVYPYNAKNSLGLTNIFEGTHLCFDLGYSLIRVQNGTAGEDTLIHIKTHIYVIRCYALHRIILKS